MHTYFVKFEQSIKQNNVSERRVDCGFDSRQRHKFWEISSAGLERLAYIQKIRGFESPSAPQYIRRVRLVVRTTLNELTCFQTNENVQQLSRLILSISSRKRGFDSFTLRKLVASSNGRITY